MVLNDGMVNRRGHADPFKKHFLGATIFMEHFPDHWFAAQLTYLKSGTGFC